MLKFGFEYSFYKSTNIRTFDPILLWLIYVYRSVVQTLWFVSADKTKKDSKCILLVPAEPSTIYGESNSSTCSPKALICWQ